MNRFSESGGPQGYDTVEIPFIWTPKNYNGQRLGYPWFEAGWMAFGSGDPAASPGTMRPSRSPETAGVVGATQGERPADPSASAGPLTGGPDGTAGGAGQAHTDREASFAEAQTRQGSYEDSAAEAVRIAMQALDALARPDLGTPMLDAASQRNAVAQFAPPDWFSGKGQGGRVAERDNPRVPSDVV